MKKWPEEGPELLWSVKGLGIGFSSVAVAWGFVYTTGVTPIYKDGCVYITSAVEREFTRGGVILVDGYLYGSNFDGIPKGDWICLDWDSGKVMYKAKWNGNKGSIIHADCMLYCYDENTGDALMTYDIKSK